MTTDQAAGTFRRRRALILAAMAAVLAVALVVSLLALLASRDRAKELAADLRQAESELGDAERQNEEALDEAYDEGYAAGALEASFLMQARLNPTAQAAMESAWEALGDSGRGSVCLGVDLGLVEGAPVERAADPLPGVTADQLERFLRQRCRDQL